MSFFSWFYSPLNFRVAFIKKFTNIFKTNGYNCKRKKCYLVAYICPKWVDWLDKIRGIYNLSARLKKHKTRLLV
jgi:hypothetical protein